MKKSIVVSIVITAFLLLTCNISVAGIKSLKVSNNGRFLVTTDDHPVFLNADTAWEIAWRLNKNDVDFYLNKRNKQKFNAIGVVAFPGEKTLPNFFGKFPFEIKDGRFNPLKPIVKNSYDYWNHLEYIIDSAAKRKMYVILLPCWGSCVAGTYSCKPNKDIIFNETNAYLYAKWIADKFKNKNNILWMLGGDRSAVKGKYDFRNIYKRFAKGLTDGSGNKKILISFHPQKWSPNSSEWFHNESWLSFNSIQDQPSDQIKAIQHDWNLKPAKPTWLFEGGYEGRVVQGKVYKDKEVRVQAIQTVFAGGFGSTYGNMAVYNFSKDWKKHLDDPGANQMKNVIKFMSLLSKEQYLTREMDQSLLYGNTGKNYGPEGMFSSRVVAFTTKKKDLAMIYTAGGKEFNVRMHKLKGPKMITYWYNPETGLWKIPGKEVDKIKPVDQNAITGKDALDYQFYVPNWPPRDKDWILILSSEPINYKENRYQYLGN